MYPFVNVAVMRYLVLLLGVVSVAFAVPLPPQVSGNNTLASTEYPSQLVSRDLKEVKFEARFVKPKTEMHNYQQIDRWRAMTQLDHYIYRMRSAFVRGFGFEPTFANDDIEGEVAYYNVETRMVKVEVRAKGRPHRQLRPGRPGISYGWYSWSPLYYEVPEPFEAVVSRLE
ncbi:hypothetical protein C8R42DRAFT_61012 [Lentinula raphanica]|nr:hypothetical protein C8R42DRAFT_61012 [Lentinula raphanica]